jgi:hypothetical protein
MAITLGGYPAVDPRSLYDWCLKHKVPVDTWWTKANGFNCPIGPGPGTGHLLLTKKNLDRLDKNAQHDLAFNDFRKKVTLKNLVIGAERCVTPGLRGDPAATYLVDLYDRRQLLRLVAIDTEYNRLDCAGDPNGDVPSGSGCSGSGPDPDLWEWDQMVCDIWGMMPGLGAYPGLPFSPHDYPQNLTFYATYAYDALNAVLDRIGCALTYNPIADTFGIVQVGEDDSAVEAALREIDHLRNFDFEPVTGITLGTVPAKVRVRFRRYPAPRQNGNPWHTDELRAPEWVGGTFAEGSSAIIDDDMPAVGSTGEPENSLVLSRRARERRDDYYRMLVGGLDRVFVGVQADERLLPGKQVKAISWRDIGRGIVTEVYRGLKVLPPFDLAKFAAPAYPASCSEMVGEGSGSGGTSSVDGDCCHSGVTLHEFRCTGGTFQQADLCVRLESGNLLVRDYLCRVVTGRAGCGGVVLKEFEVISSGTPETVEIVETLVTVNIEAGQLVKREATTCTELERGSCSGTGITLRALECLDGVISPKYLCLGLECGRLVLREGMGDYELIDDGLTCCQTVDDCAATVDELTWYDTACQCVANFCAGQHLPPSVDYVATGRAGTGCEGAVWTGSAPWVSDLSAYGFNGTGGLEDLTGVPGYLFTIDGNGHTCLIAWYCNTSWDGDPPNEVRCFISVACDGVACGAGVDNSCFGDPIMPGTGGFTVDFQTGGAGACGACAGYIDFITSDP